MATDIAHIVPIFTATCRGLRANGRVYAEALTTAWVQMGLHDAQCLSSLFLTASRHLAVQHEDAALQGRREMFTGMAVRYKVMSVRAVSRAIAESGSGRAFRDVVFMKTLALAFDEVGRMGWKKAGLTGTGASRGLSHDETTCTRRPGHGATEWGVGHAGIGWVPRDGHISVSRTRRAAVPGRFSARGGGQGGVMVV